MAVSVQRSALWAGTAHTRGAPWHTERCTPVARVVRLARECWALKSSFAIMEKVSWAQTTAPE